MVWKLESEESLVDYGTSLEFMCVICVYIRTPIVGLLQYSLGLS